MRLILVCLMMLLFACYGCKKKHNEVMTYYIPAQLKSYSIFQVGSFWIYKNEVTGKVDSSYILYAPNFSYSHEGGYEYDPILERCIIYYGGSFLKETDISIQGYILFFNAYVFMAINPGSFLPGQTFKLEAGKTLENLAILDSLTISNTTFYNVFVTQWRYASAVADTIKLSSYFVENVGLIKLNRQEPGADTTWNLINYHVIQ